MTSNFETAYRLLNISFYDNAITRKNATLLVNNAIAPFTNVTSVADVVTQFEQFAAEEIAADEFYADEVNYDLDFVKKALA